VNSFISEFRGTEAQRDPDTFDVETVAFDFQSFLTRQYQLAPNKGASGAAVYPSFEDTGVDYCGWSNRVHAFHYNQDSSWEAHYWKPRS
jgi:hypothetical protein